MNHETSLLCESVQEMTLYAWPIIWNDNKYDQDSREVLITIREWAEEFDNWWMSHDENWRDRMDYVEELGIFAARKCKEYLKELCVDPETGETKIFDETGHLIATRTENAPENKGHIEETIDVMIAIASLAEHRLSDEVCDRDVKRELTKEWGREFSNWYYCELSHDERLEKDYYKSLCEFVDRKLTEYKEPKPKDYIVHITRTEKYEADVLVSATSEEEAEKKVEEAWGDGKHDWLYAKMTDTINCDSQTYKAHEAQPGENPDFSI